VTDRPVPRLDALDLTRRARAAYGPDGRLALPPQAFWPIFPFETDGLQMRAVEDPVLPEPPRNGEHGPDGCWTCAEGGTDPVWSDERWLVVMSAQPQSLPALTLHTRAHLDFDALTDEMAVRAHVAAALALRP
jgi:hypothetical protein